MIWALRTEPRIAARPSLGIRERGALSAVAAVASLLGHVDSGRLGLDDAAGAGRVDDLPGLAPGRMDGGKRRCQEGGGQQGDPQDAEDDAAHGCGQLGRARTVCLLGERGDGGGVKCWETVCGVRLGDRVPNLCQCIRGAAALYFWADDQQPIRPFLREGRTPKQDETRRDERTDKRAAHPR